MCTVSAKKEQKELMSTSVVGEVTAPVDGAYTTSYQPISGLW